MDTINSLSELNSLIKLLNKAVVIIRTDNLGRITHVNEKFTQISGYSNEEILGKKYKFVNTWRQSKGYFADIVKTVSSGSIWTGELKNRAKDKSYYWLEASIAPFYDNAGNICEYAAICTDITGKKKAEENLEFRVMERTAELDEMNEKLRESYLIYSGLFDNNKSVMLMVDAETGAITDANPAACRFYGYNNVEIIRKNIAELDIIPLSLTYVQSSSSQLGSILVTQHKLADGSIRDVEVHISSIIMNDKEYLFSIVHDITEKKRAEKELIENEKMIRDLMNAAGDAIIIVDGKGIITHWNLAAEKMFEFTAEEAIGHTVDNLLRPSDFFNIVQRSAVADILGELNQYSKVIYEHKARKKSGVVFPVEASISLVTLGDKEMAIGFSRDITDRKKLEAHMLLSQKLESIGQLAAGIAHEINTPMQFISDNVNFLNEAFNEIKALLQKYENLKKSYCTVSGTAKCIVVSEIEDMDIEYLSQEIPKAIDQTLEGISRVTQIILAMKDFSHSGGKDMQYSDLNKAIESTVLVSRNEWKYRAEMELNLDKNLPPVCCTIDEVNQVILNMIVNAAQAIEAAISNNSGEKGDERKGKIIISTLQNGDCAQITIEDNGIGMAPDMLNRIFEPFFTTKEVGKGTGQGLSIAHNIIIGKHKGSIQVESEPGRGTKFIIELPISCVKEQL
jgi:PAS domain S-box-containing protein